MLNRPCSAFSISSLYGWYLLLFCHLQRDISKLYGVILNVEWETRQLQLTHCHDSYKCKYNQVKWMKCDTTVHSNSISLPGNIWVMRLSIVWVYHSVETSECHQILLNARPQDEPIIMENKNIVKRYIPKCEAIQFWWNKHDLYIACSMLETTWYQSKMP